jgi:hypothetical protein
VTQKAAKSRGTTAAAKARRSRAIEMLAMGAEVQAVAAELSVSRETVTRWQRDGAAAIDAASEARVEGVVEGGARAKARLVANGEELAAVLVDGAMGRLRIHLDPADRPDAELLPIERDPQMVNARVNAASKALAFIIATKSETDVGSSALERVVEVMRASVKAARG